MAKAEHNAKAPWILLVVILLVAGGPAVYFLFTHSRSASVEITAGRNIFSGVERRGRDSQLLATLSWADVAATAEGIGTNQVLLQDVLAFAQQRPHPPALYLQAILLLAANEPDAALAAFDRIPIAEIPSTHLYAPYRLHNTIQPLETNPFRAAMIQAIEQRRVPPLTQARVLGAEGSLPEALKAYLQSDPASWTTRDVQIIRSLRMHAALANSTAVMIQGALRAGRVPEGLRGDLIEVLKATQSEVALNALKTQFLQQLDRNPDIRRAAVAGAERQLALRQLFVGKGYRELVDQCRGLNALELPDETVLMLVLSAAQVSDVPAFDQWSQELKRRYPTPEVEKWAQELRPSIQ